MKVNLLRGKGTLGRRRVVAIAGALLVGTGVIAFAGTQASAVTPAAAGPCSVTYTVTTQWDTGFGVDIKATNLGAAVTSWSLTFGYTGTQAVQSGWNGTWTQSGKNVTVTNADWNGAVASGGVIDVGANFTYSGTNSAPASFSLNGVTCGGPGTPPPTTTTPPV